MRFSRALAPLVASLVLSGCGYVHFGRLPMNGSGDMALQHANADLALEQKILKQELVLAHKEADSLRAALERSGSANAAPSPQLVRELESTTAELATLRASYAKLKAERTAAAGSADTMATADVATLRDENTRLRHDLEASRQENATLAEQLKASVAQNQEAQASLTQLNTELLDQKQARERAEQATIALRAQLEAVMARAGRSDSLASSAPATGAGDSSGTVATVPTNPLTALQGAKAPPSGAVPVVELRTNLTQARAAAANGVPAPTRSSAASPKPSIAGAAPTADDAQSTAAQNTATATPIAAARTYTVQAGDTLEKIAVKVYGAADQWGKIYDANATALGAGQGLKAGMKLEIP